MVVTDICNEIPTWVKGTLRDVLLKACKDGVMDVARPVEDLQKAINGNWGEVSQESQLQLARWLKSIGEKHSSPNVGLKGGSGGVPTGQFPGPSPGMDRLTTPPIPLDALGIKAAGSVSVIVDGTWRPGSAQIEGAYLWLKIDF